MKFDAAKLFPQIMNSYQPVFFLKSKQVHQPTNQKENIGILPLAQRGSIMLQDNDQPK